MPISKSRVFTIAVAFALALFQLLLMPLLTCGGRGMKAILAEGDAFSVCLAVFLAVLAASFRSSVVGRSEALWHCAFRAALWSAVMTLFFFQIWCIGFLGLEENPPRLDLHGNAAIIFFAIMWYLSFRILRIAVRRDPGQPSAC